MIPYNLLYSKLLHRLSAALSGAKVAVVARSPFGYGVLADTWGASRRFRDEDHRMYRWSAADVARRVRQREGLRPLVKGDIASMRDLALRYVLANGLVSVVVPGARMVVHARQNTLLRRGPRRTSPTATWPRSGSSSRRWASRAERTARWRSPM